MKALLKIYHQCAVYTYSYIVCIHRSVMARLYWRVKKNGKWTWTSAVDVGKDESGFICVIPYEEESE